MRLVAVLGVCECCFALAARSLTFGVVAFAAMFRGGIGSIFVMSRCFIVFISGPVTSQLVPWELRFNLRPLKYERQLWVGVGAASAPRAGNRQLVLMTPEYCHLS